MNDLIIRTDVYHLREFADDYQILEYLGKDELSAVFNAKELRTGDIVTLIFLRDLINVKHHREEFIKLVKEVSHLNHPLICPIRKAYIPLDTSRTNLPRNLFQLIIFFHCGLSSIIKTDLIKNRQFSIYNYKYLQSKGEYNIVLNPTIRSKVIFGIASLMQYLL